MNLDEYLWQNKVHQRDFAAAVDVTESMVSKVRKGIRTPSIAVAMRIEKATNGKVLASELVGLTTPTMVDVPGFEKVHIHQSNRPASAFVTVPATVPDGPKAIAKAKRIKRKARRARR